MFRFGLLWYLIFFIGCAAFAQSPPSSDPLGDIAESHVRANVPAPATFNKYLIRDLTSYFAQLIGKNVIVKYEMLREGPTQTGVSSPKYYLWVNVFRGSKLVAAGAVRIAAIDQKQFEVTDYLARARMERNLKQVYLVFPRAVSDKINKQYLKRGNLPGSTNHRA